MDEGPHSARLLGGQRASRTLGLTLSPWSLLGTRTHADDQQRDNANEVGRLQLFLVVLIIENLWTLKLMFYLQERRV